MAFTIAQHLIIIIGSEQIAWFTTLIPKKIPDNFRANYRVWRQIIKSLMAEREAQKENKKIAKKASLSDFDHQDL